jgi:plasmid stabilization system protein ParE
MALKIIWTANALEDYKRVIDYLVKEWSAGIAERFSENVQARLETLSNYPFLGIVSTKDLSVRSISISRHNRLYYRVTSIAIEVLDIFDTRQNPEKNRYD